MKSLLKGFGGLLSLGFLMLIGFWAFIQTINFDQVVNDLHRELKDFTQLPVVIKGQTTFKFFPRPSIHLYGIEIGSPSAASPYFIQFNELYLKLGLRPLLKKQIVFNELQVERFHILLQTTPSPTHPARTASTVEVLAERRLAINQVTLKQGTIETRSSTAHLLLTAFQLNAQQVNATTPFPLQFRTIIKAEVNHTPLFSGLVGFKGTVSLPIECLVDPNHFMTYLVLNGQLRADDAVLNSVNIKQIHATFQSKSNNLLFNPMALTLSRGEALGDLIIDTSTGRAYLNQTATNLDGASFLTQFFDKNPLTGNLDVSLHAQLNLGLPHPLNSLSGNGSFSLREGQIRSFNLKRFIDQARLKVHQLVNSTHSSPNHSSNVPSDPGIFKGNTPFKLLTIEYNIQNALFISNRFIFQSALLELDGKGEYHVDTEQINAQLSAHVELEEGDLSHLQTLLGGAFPLHLSGPLSDLHIIPDASKIQPLIQPMIVRKIMEQPFQIIQKQINDLFDSPQSRSESNDH